VGVDLSRIASAAVEAALEDDRPRRRFRGVRAVAAGAALATAARVAVAKGPGVPRLLNGVTRLPDEARRRLTDMGWLDEEDEDLEEDEELDDEEYFDEPEAEADDEEPEDEEPEDEEPEPEEPEPEAEAEDVEPEDEEEEPEEEPVAEEESDDEEPVGEEHSSNGGERSGAPPLSLSGRRSPRVMARARGGEGLHPADRPPEPPESDSHDNANGRSG
jgi:outer membrane biosynthesis protein TonB